MPVGFGRGIKGNTHYPEAIGVSYKGGKADMDMTAQMNDAFGRAMQGYMAANPAATQQQAQAAIMAQFTGMGIDLSKGVRPQRAMNIAPIIAP